jgi:hypothetical protein
LISRTSATILGAIVGGFAAAGAIVLWFGWGGRAKSKFAYIAPSRDEYVDLLLTITSIFLSAIGVTITVGALVIGLVAFKTLREIKTEAAGDAKTAAAAQITDTIAAELAPKVSEKVSETLPQALRTALLQNELGHQILREMAQRGELDEVLERVAMRMQNGGPEIEAEEGSHFLDEGNQS